MSSSSAGVPCLSLVRFFASDFKPRGPSDRSDLSEHLEPRLGKAKEGKAVLTHDKQVAIKSPGTFETGYGDS